MLYSKRRVKNLTARLKAEYTAALEEKDREMASLKEENRTLAARVLKLEEERKSVADALIFAVKAGEKLSEEQRVERENEERERILLARKCRELSLHGRAPRGGRRGRARGDGLQHGRRDLAQTAPRPRKTLPRSRTHGG